MDLGYLALLALLIFGFGFVIFWHELGHFLAAKWAGVEVEQFAVGFGQALVSWRKGFGFKVGTSRMEYEKRLRQYLADQEAALKNDPEFSKLSTDRQRLDYASVKLDISPTEYRLNWMPLGGYVKMLGQDDLDPTAKSDSPNSYNNKSIGKRMVIVSAGVVMNVILAVVLFVLLFMIGFNAPPPVVGTVLSNSPAQQAGIKVGDRILEIDGWEQHDFTKIAPNVALAEEGEALDVLVLRADGTTKEHVSVTPHRTDPESGGFLQIGVGPIRAMRAPDVAAVPAPLMALLEDAPLRPGETIVAVNGTAVNSEDYRSYLVLDNALQTGREVTITVEDASATQHDRKVIPRFVPPFGAAPLNFAGMVPRTVVSIIESWSSAKDKLMPGDIIAEVRIPQNNDQIPHPSHQVLKEVLHNAGQNERMVDVTVIRNGERQTFAGLDPTKYVRQDRQGLGIGLDVDEDHAVIAQVLPDSAAARAGVPAGATITAIAGQPVTSWRDVHRLLSAAEADRPVGLTLATEGDLTQQIEMTLTRDQLALVRMNHYTSELLLDESRFERYTTNPLEAAQWGVLETRDLMVQFYNMIRRMFQGSVSPKNAIGPVGIFDFGSKIAGRGADWVIWFLAMISANLAVVNFLPIPIVDGGLFLFLVLEKVMGRPLSPKAQGIVQLVGLALIVGVFLFVTYHDITRLIY